MGSLSILAVGLSSVLIAGIRQSTPPVRVLRFTNVPAQALVGETLSLTGRSAPSANITIKVTPPSGAAQNLSAHADGSGTFSTSFSALSRVGDYTFQARSGDLEATIRVKAVPAEQFSQDAQQDVVQIQTDVETLITRGNEIEFPNDDPAVREYKKKIADLTEGVQYGRAIRDLLGDTLPDYLRIANCCPEVHTAQKDDLDALHRWRAQLSQARTSLSQAVAPIRGKDMCLTLEAIRNVFRDAAQAVRIVDDGSKVIANATKEEKMDSLVRSVEANKLISPRDQVLIWISQLRSQLQTRREQASGKLERRILEFYQANANQILDKYCGRLEGATAARIVVENYQNGAPWLKYTLRIDGFMSLMMPRNANLSEGQPVSGFLRGNATGFQFWEDIFLVEPKPAGMAVIDRQGIFPDIFKRTSPDPKTEWGSPRPGSAAYFEIPVTGTLRSNKLELTLGAARNDFDNDFKAQIYVKLTGKGAPIERTFDFPLQKAHFMYDVATEHHIEIPVTTDGNVIKAKKFFSRTANPSEKTKVQLEALFDGQFTRRS